MTKEPERIELYVVQWRQRNVGRWNAIGMYGDMESAQQHKTHWALNLPGNQFVDADKTRIVRIEGTVVDECP